RKRPRWHRMPGLKSLQKSSRRFLSSASHPRPAVKDEYPTTIRPAATTVGRRSNERSRLTAHQERRDVGVRHLSALCSLSNAHRRTSVKIVEVEARDRPV